MYMCIYIYIYLFIYLHTCMYIYIYVHVYTYIYIDIHIGMGLGLRVKDFWASGSPPKTPNYKPETCFLNPSKATVLAPAAASSLLNPKP